MKKEKKIIGGFAGKILHVDLTTKKVKEEEHNEKMEKFISSLPHVKKDTGLHFMDNVYTYLKKNKIDPAIKEVIERNKEG